MKKSTAKKAATTKPKRTKRTDDERDGKRCPVDVGKAYQFMFPRHNFEGVLSPLEPRRLLVQKVRDLEKEPLDRITVEIQPLLRRGRFLATGIDLDTGLERRFYTESMREIEQLDAIIRDRRVITAYVVDEQLFEDQHLAVAVAEKRSALEHRSINVEMIKIPATLKRTLFRAVRRMMRRVGKAKIA